MRFFPIEPGRLHRQPYPGLRRLPVGAGNYSVPVSAIERICAMKRSYSVALTAPLIFAMCGAFSIASPAGAETQKAAAPVKIIHPEVLRMPAAELKDLLAKKADIVVIDVNPKDFYDSWHIPSAINIPYNSMDGAAQRERKLKKIPVGKLIVLYCLCEEGADSSEEALELRRLGHAWKNVKVLEGGLTQWDAKGYPIYKQEPNP
jgi:rhodanese-related sulfurtransferase